MSRRSSLTAAVSVLLLFGAYYLLAQTSPLRTAALRIRHYETNPLARTLTLFLPLSPHDAFGREPAPWIGLLRAGVFVLLGLLIYQAMRAMTFSAGLVRPALLGAGVTVVGRSG